MIFQSVDPSEVSLEVGGVSFRHWSSFELRQSIDSYSSVAFVAPFERDQKEMRDLFKPFAFQPVEVRIGGVVVFTGVVVNVEPSVEPVASSVTVSAYAGPAVLEDCTAPASLYPLEFRKMKLRSIAEALCAPFGLSVTVRGEQGAAFKKVAIDAEQKVHQFLVDLASQRGLVLSDTTDGNLWIGPSEPAGAPVARFGGEGGFMTAAPPIQPATKITPRFNARAYYSEITGIGKAKRKNTGSKYTAKNQRLDIVRPFAFTTDDVEKGELPRTVDMKLGRMFGSMVSYVMGPIPTWHTADGALFQPNTTIMVAAPEAMVYNETEFLIRTVVLRQEAGQQMATFDLVLPGAFSGEVPERLPWE